VQRAAKWGRRHRPLAWSAAVALVAILTAVAGSVGYVLRDRSARQAVLSARVTDALDESETLYRVGKVSEALNAVQRAASLLDIGPADEALTARVRELVADLQTALKFDEALFTLHTDRPAEYDQLFRD